MYSYDRISMALNNLTRLRHLLDAFSGINRSLPTIKAEGSNDYTVGSSGSAPLNTGSGGNISQMTSLSSSLDIVNKAPHHSKFLKPEALVANLRAASADSMESHDDSILSLKEEEEKEKERGDGEKPSGYDMLNMLATVANRNGKDILSSANKKRQSLESTSSATGEESSKVPDSASKLMKPPQFLFENPIPEQVSL